MAHFRHVRRFCRTVTGFALLRVDMQASQAAGVKGAGAGSVAVAVVTVLFTFKSLCTVNRRAGMGDETTEVRVREVEYMLFAGPSCASVLGTNILPNSMETVSFLGRSLGFFTTLHFCPIAPFAFAYGQLQEVAQVGRFLDVVHTVYISNTFHCLSDDHVYE